MYNNICNDNNNTLLLLLLLLLAFVLAPLRPIIVLTLWISEGLPEAYS